jgi:hypothetical protein
MLPSIKRDRLRLVAVRDSTALTAALGIGGFVEKTRCGGDPGRADDRPEGRARYPTYGYFMDNDDYP